MSDNKQCNLCGNTLEKRTDSYYYGHRIAIGRINNFLTNESSSELIIVCDSCKISRGVVLLETYASQLLKFGQAVLNSIEMYKQQEMLVDAIRDSLVKKNK